MIGLLNRRQKRTPIGIDAGANGARAVQLVRDEDGYRVLHAVCSERPGAGADDEPRAIRMGRHINACIQQGLFKGAVAVAGLDTPDIEFHTLELPRASCCELEQIVRLEVERLMTLSAQDAEIRHWILPEANASAPNALGVVAPTDVILETFNACRQAKLVCSEVHPSATALCRLGCLLQQYEAEAIWGVLDLGHSQTRLIVCADEVPVLVRSVGRGGRAWTQRIAEALQTSFKTAEVQKRDHGITAPARAGAAGFSPRGVPNADGIAGLRSTAQAEACGSGMSSMLLGILRSDLNELALEVKRSYEYVLTCYPNRHAFGLILVGGGAALHNLPEFLSDSLGIVVHRASHFLNEPACRLHYEAVGQSPLERFALAVGLAVEE